MQSNVQKVVFLSNYFNHHQKPFSDAMYRHCGEGYVFIETTEMPEYRKKLGYRSDSKPSYVKRIDCCNYASLIEDADIVIMGSAPYKLLKNRLRSGKLTFVYSERIYKDKCQNYKIPYIFLVHQKMYGKYKNLYLLCSSAFTSADYAKTYAFPRKAYKWGYFPEAKISENIGALIESKKAEEILWCGRFTKWKHPEAAIYVAKRLKNEGYDFQLDIIGTGELEEALCRLIAENGLIDCVHLLGSMTPEEVRRHMEEASIYLFTSDRHEGWGAVLNESMNSACAVVASHAIGSVPFLLEHERNGLIYRDGDLEDLTQKVKYLLDHPEDRNEISRNAYETIANEWNAENAAERLLILFQKLLAGERHAKPFENGVCSKAEIIRDNWFTKGNRKIGK